MPEISLESAVRPGADVLHRVLDGETVLLDVNDGVYYGLDEVGTRIWELLVAGTSLEGVLETVVAEYDVGAEQARSDLLRLVSELVEQGLLEVEAPEAPEGAGEGA